MVNARTEAGPRELLSDPSATDSAYLPALAALAGSVMGGLATLVASAWLQAEEKLIDERSVDPLRSLARERRAELRAF